MAVRRTPAGGYERTLGNRENVAQPATVVVQRNDGVRAENSVCGVELRRRWLVVGCPPLAPALEVAPHVLTP